MPPVPMSNATLHSVSNAGTTQNFSHPGGTSAPVWEGACRIMVERKASRRRDERREDRVITTTLYVPSGRVPGLSPGHSVSWEGDDQSVHHGVIEEVEETRSGPAVAPIVCQLAVA